ncbi:TfdA family Taurine catabolism dioxygenase TauD [Fusarium austroafricanum]|uniref:TfdA family Taurine catabolism dioxygenase TauD n=1 Tax=Fusarium austroafricanum TaxID=2364996 RepID=A0A8H4NZV3_9HYPO|nr:TfdA family Taurine catabolism dioxygenase TauD [Fusarium austroafricanum]
MASSSSKLGNEGSSVPPRGDYPPVRSGHREPLESGGSFDQFEHVDLTPIIGREYLDIDLASILRASNSNELIRDLAIIISQRGVVFFRKQDNITNELQKELVQRLGELSGKPSASKLHIHPVNNSKISSYADDEISVVSSEQAKKLNTSRFLERKQSQRNQWHSDIAFEPVPSDYALLRMLQLPNTGGDTLWASGYEVYDRISYPLRTFLETLTATYAQPGFNQNARDNGLQMYSGERGAPENKGELLEAIHPVVRTNPVTGWKSIYAVGQHVSYINGLSDDESNNFLNWFLQLVIENHDLQVRSRWQNVNDIAIWDNRCTYHAATPDYLYGDFGAREGTRAVSVGERPYFDPQSKSRSEDLESSILQRE